MISVLVLTLSVLVQDTELPLLRVGETVEGVIEDGAPDVHTEALDAGYSEAPTVGRAFRFEVAVTGPYCVELRSWDFDAYLVLSDFEGNVLAEDDDGLLANHPRIAIPELKAGSSYRLDVCALHGARGAFELLAREGEPRELSAREKSEALVVDRRRRVEALERRGGESLELADELNKLGFELYRLGRYAETREMSERSLEIREKVLGPDHPDVAQGLNNLGVLLTTLGETEGVREMFERALAIREEELGPGNPGTLKTMQNLVGLLRAQGELDAARRLAERALSITEEVHGPDHLLTAERLVFLTTIMGMQGEYAAARPMSERALAIRERELGARHPAVAESLHNLASLLMHQAEVTSARLLAERALAIREEVLGPEHPRTAMTSNNLGELLLLEGDLANARWHYERAIAIWEKVLGPDHPETATGLANLAEVLVRQGELSGARPLLERSLAIQEKALGPHHPKLVHVLFELGQLMEAMDEHEAAVPLLERSLATCRVVLGPEHPSTASCLGGLARSLEMTGDVAGARECLEEALAINEATQGPGHPNTAASLHNLALMRWNSGESESAILEMRRSLGIVIGALGTGHPKTVEASMNAALMLASVDDIVGARDVLSRCALGGRAQNVQRTLNGLSEVGGFQFLATLRWQLEILLNLSESEDPAVLTRGYDGVLAWKGQVTRRLMATRESLVRDLTDEQRDLVTRLMARQAELSRLLTGIGSDDPDRVSVVVEDRDAIELELRRSLPVGELDNQASFREVRDALAPGVGLVDLFLQRDLVLPHRENGKVVGGMHLGEERLIAWITRPEEEGTPLARVDLGPAETVGVAVRRHLRDFVRARSGAPERRGVSPGSKKEAAPRAQETLRRVLWDPLAPHLEGVETLVVSPDGELGTLPFESIQLADGSFLIEHLAVVYLTDITSLVGRPESPGSATGSLLAVGDVDFDERAEDSELDVGSAQGVPAATRASMRGGFGITWGALPATGSEVRTIEALSTSARARSLVLTGRAPTEDRLKRELERFEVLHLATHGFFNPEGLPSMWESAQSATRGHEPVLSHRAAQLSGRHPGLLSGLVCAGANLEAPEGVDDGYLTAEEVGWLDLSKVELVVMSACETGLGRAQSGEGLIGLRRAFRTAGAKTVISSLWQVEDESTAELMSDFYENLWMKGMGRLEALRAAQLAMLARNREEHGAALPHTWGAFVLSGEWR